MSVHIAECAACGHKAIVGDDEHCHVEDCPCTEFVAIVHTLDELLDQLTNGARQIINQSREGYYPPPEHIQTPEELARQMYCRHHDVGRFEWDSQVERAAYEEASRRALEDTPEQAGGWNSP